MPLELPILAKKTISSLCDWGDESEHQDEVAATSGEHKNVPQIVSGESPGPEVGPFGGINHRSNRVKESASRQPAHRGRRNCLPDRTQGDHDEPAHAEIQDHTNPARSISPEKHGGYSGPGHCIFGAR